MSAQPESLPVAVRAHTTRSTTRPSRAQRRLAAQREPRFLLVFDTETTIDETQRLLFGVWCYYRRREHTWVCVQEGIFHADDLPDCDPVGYQELRDYVARNIQRTDHGVEQPLLLLSRAEFCEQVLFRAAYLNQARVVGFNLPFDLSRLAIAVAAGRGRNRGGFSFTLFAGAPGSGHRENKHRPRVQVKHVDSKRAFISFATAMRNEHENWRGDFVDVRTLTFALTGQGHSLESGCEAFGLPGKQQVEEHGRITSDYIDYCRQDVAATFDLYVAADAELASWGIDLPPHRAYSPASIAKNMLNALGVRPRLELQPDFDPQVLGWCMSAFYGGRAECHIRKTPVPVSLVDFTATYPSLFALLDLWPYVIAQKLREVEATDAVRALLASVTHDDCFDPALWPQLVGIAQIAPDDDVLPVRAQYNEYQPSYGIGLNHLTSDEPMWFTLPDLVASTLLSDRSPKILRAIRFDPIGVQPGLRPVTLPGGLTIDPTVQAPFPAMVEHRQRVRVTTDLTEQERQHIQLGLKITANAGAYGIFAEYNPDELPTDKTCTVDVFGQHDHSFAAKVHAPEDPGQYSCPPLAAVITGAARLLLAMLERSVTDAGGTWAFADTDSMAIVATPNRRLVPCVGGDRRTRDGQPAVLALSYKQVEEIQARFTTLNPYDRDAVPQLLKHELDATAHVIAAKRYALYTTDKDGQIELLDRSVHDVCSHGLGHLLNPIDPEATDRDWIAALWTTELTRDLGIGPVVEPDWYDRPAIARTTISTPDLLKTFAAYNRGKPYAQQIKPFNFVLHAPRARRTGSTSPITLLAPYNTNPTTWTQRIWRDKNDPERLLRIGSGCDDPDAISVPTYREIATTHTAHPEIKSNTPDGRPCGRADIGLLARRHVHADAPTHIGKEANRLEQREDGLLSSDEQRDYLLLYKRMPRR